VTIEFLEEAATGLRSATVASSPVECLIGTRSALRGSLGDMRTRIRLDVPGVYLLYGPPATANDETGKDSRLYIGQADSVADRLDQHLSAKPWWRAVVAIRRPEKSPFDLSQCKFLESELFTLAKTAGECELMNRNTPQAAFLSEKRIGEARELMRSALFILSGLGLNFFAQTLKEVELSDPLAEKSEDVDSPGAPPAVSPTMQPLLEELRKRLAASFPKAEWYWTRVPDYRARIVSADDFRVFMRVRLAAKWLRVALKDVGQFKLKSSDDLVEIEKELVAAYKKAEDYLQRNR
jgi:hypothetical protein